MIKTINVHLKERGYKILVGRGLLSKTGDLLKGLKIGNDAVIISNRTIFAHHGKKLLLGLKRAGLSAKTLLVPDSEKSKSAGVVFSVLKKMAAYDVRKNIFLIAFGGGVVGDAGGFLASIYKRGIPLVQVPTTFLAQIDSAIGGKAAIDLAAGKNLVGSFYQPRMVISDIDVLSTVGLRQIRNGMAEAIKYGVICDRALFRFIERNYRGALAGRQDVLAFLVHRCSRIKAAIVSADEKETKALRTILNFGHTAGHAIEAAGAYQRYQHGEAIALGMRVAADIARQLKLFSQQDCQRLEKILSLIDLPQRIQGLSMGRILKVMAHDKKFKGSVNRFVLPVSIGRVKVIENVPRKVIEKALRKYL